LGIGAPAAFLILLSFAYIRFTLARIRYDERGEAAARVALSKAIDDLPAKPDWAESYARSKRALTSQGVKETLTRAERALEIQALHIPQAQIDAMQADAAAKLIAAFDPVPNALVQIGSVLLLKVDGTPIVRNLTQIELSYLEHNKHLYRSPKDTLEELGGVSEDATRFALPSE
jgi:hypothetical protein